MSVLRAIFSHPRQVSLDIARIMHAVGERGREQHDQSRVFSDEMLVKDFIAMRACSGSPAREITLQLCAIESILQSSLSAEPSGDPSSKYARRYHAPSQLRLHSSVVIIGESHELCADLPVSARIRMLGKFSERDYQEPGEPDALTSSFDADAIHAVVPVAASNQRKPMLALRARSS